MTTRLRFLADEDFDNDIVRAQDVDLSGKHDTLVLEWAAQAGRVLFTHDVSTMKTHTHARVARGLPMPGVFAVGQFLPVGEAIEAILLLAECSLEGEWEGQIRHLPL